MNDENPKCPHCGSTNLHKKEQWAAIYFFCKDCKHRWQKDLGDCLDTSLDRLGEILESTGPEQIEEILTEIMPELDSEKLKITEEESNKIVDDLLEMMELSKKEKDKTEEKKWSKLPFSFGTD